MNGRTIEMDFEYQMAQSLRELLRRNEKSLDSFETPNDLMSFLWNEREEFGKIVVERMSEWTSEEDWMSILQIEMKQDFLSIPIEMSDGTVETLSLCKYCKSQQHPGEAARHKYYCPYGHDSSVHERAGKGGILSNTT
jgi:hypothetical protein